MGKIKLSSMFIGLSLFFLLLSMGAAAQNGTLEGTVKDVTGSPLIGVNVIQKVYQWNITDMTETFRLRS